MKFAAITVLLLGMPVPRSLHRKFKLRRPETLICRYRHVGGKGWTHVPNSWAAAFSPFRALFFDEMSFCQEGGGLWPAFQALVTFLVTNIFAHAATIHLPSGLNSTSTILAIINSIFLPVFAGDRAFHSINRWGARLFTGKMAIGDVLGGATLEDGATSGVIVVCVPLRFAPILCGRWSRVTTDQNTTTLGNAIFWQPNPNLKLPFKVDGKFQKYVPFVLPPTTRFPGYRNFRISPSAAGLGQIVGVVQIVLSSRQLYLNYSDSLLTDGLSSPYVSVIPYILMSTVNLVTNTLVGSYTQVTVLPMARDTLPKDNEVFIAGSGADEYPLHVFALPENTPTIPPIGKTQPPVNDTAIEGTILSFMF